MSDGQSEGQTQTAFLEQSIREGHSMAAVQMWQNLCRRMALLGSDSLNIAHVMLQLSDEVELSPLHICDQLRANGVKKLDGKTMGLLSELADAMRQAAENVGSEETERSDDADNAPTQPMTPPPHRTAYDVINSPTPASAPKKKKMRMLDLSAEED